MEPIYQSYLDTKAQVKKNFPGIKIDEVFVAPQLEEDDGPDFLDINQRPAAVESDSQAGEGDQYLQLGMDSDSPPPVMPTFAKRREKR